MRCWGGDPALIAGMFALIGASALAGCDPLINIAGAVFPGWLLCLIIGAGAAAVIRPAFTFAGIEDYLGPLFIVYPCLALLVACIVWIFCFNRI